ncbi:MAG: preprotein translocase subunit YajC [Prolixibacteraceae bacterium]|jgi:preprotein translocase subunit YajC|nr:preprotein translocase subunit YajC [Prolixibacteraceae bacterium]
MLNYILMAQPSEGSQASPYSGLIMMVLIIVVFYFFMIRPQMKRQKELRKFRESIQKGDNVVTTGGIYGKVSEVKENVILLQVDEGVKLKVDKSAVVKDMSDVAAQK